MSAREVQPVDRASAFRAIYRNAPPLVIALIIVLHAFYVRARNVVGEVLRCCHRPQRTAVEFIQYFLHILCVTRGLYSHNDQSTCVDR